MDGFVIGRGILLPIEIQHSNCGGQPIDNGRRIGCLRFRGCGLWGNRGQMTGMESN